MRYRSIAFGGGGMRGAAHVGALKAIQEVQGSLEFPDGVYGSSVGAIVASLVAFNVPVDTISSNLKNYFKLSMWLPYPSVRDVWSISERRGVLTMDRLRTSIVECFTTCGIQDVETKRVRDAPQPLFIIASNLSTKRPAILTGDVPLIQAILCSSCIPGLFEPQVLYGDVYLDAAVYVRAIEQIAPPNALAIKLYDHAFKITPKSSLMEIFQACYAGIPKPHPGVDVCVLHDLPTGIINDVTDAQREELLEKGYSQTLTFLTKMGAKKR